MIIIIVGGDRIVTYVIYYICNIILHSRHTRGACTQLAHSSPSLDGGEGVDVTARRRKDSRPIGALAMTTAAADRRRRRRRRVVIILLSTAVPLQYTI